MKIRNNSTVRRVTAVTVTLALALAGAATGPVTPAGAACPTVTVGDRWISAFTIGTNGSNWAEGVVDTVNGTAFTHGPVEELAAEMGREKLPFKRDVRKLKELGLTESLNPGYRLSPRGEAVLRELGRRKKGGPSLPLP